MTRIVISGTGLYTPKQSISNRELVLAFNKFVNDYNQAHTEEIRKGTLTALAESSEEFIEKASGILSRFVMEKSGILDPKIMRPILKPREDDEKSIQCEMAIHAATEALKQANRQATDIDMVIVACSNMQRAYPAIAIEVQHVLGANGYAYDMNVACSSATFGIQAAYNAIQCGNANCVLVVSPEICTGHLNFKDRDSHFIFGDACTAVILEKSETSKSNEQYEILGCHLKTLYSNNIRNNAGFLTRCEANSGEQPAEHLFKQHGRKVFKDVVPLVVEIIQTHLQQLNIQPKQLKRLFLHQANHHMNRLIAEKLLNQEITDELAPNILREYANTSSAGSIIAFHKYRNGLAKNDIVLICSFGAGYSAGNIVLKKII